MGFLQKAIFALGAVGTGMLTYGALVEARRLEVSRTTLTLPRWPERLRGFRIGVLADLHVGSPLSIELARQAVTMVLDESPDMVVIVGDFVDEWTPDSPRLLGGLLEPLLAMDGNVVAIPGNHDYKHGDPSVLRMILDELNIKLLRNQSWRHAGITWVGVDSANVGVADPILAMENVGADAVVALWHEPDLVGYLPKGASLQISGHAHGGQFVLPGGWAPMKSRNGRRYTGGYYPGAPTPLFVSRGVGTTFLPSRFNCPPEVAMLTLVPAARPLAR